MRIWYIVPILVLVGCHPGMWKKIDDVFDGRKARPSILERTEYGRELLGYHVQLVNSTRYDQQAQPISRTEIIEINPVYLKSHPDDREAIRRELEALTGRFWIIDADGRIKPFVEPEDELWQKTQKKLLRRIHHPGSIIP